MNPAHPSNPAYPENLTYPAQPAYVGRPAYAAVPAVFAWQPIYAFLVPFPFACFWLALATDIIYWRTSFLMWKHFSEWLLLAGLLLGGLAAIIAVIDFLAHRAVRAQQAAWAYLIGGGIVIILGIVNSFVHSADGWTGVIPWGLTLSAAMVIIMTATAWYGRSLAYRHRVGEVYHD